MSVTRRRSCILAFLVMAASATAQEQGFDPAKLVESGQVQVEGRAVPYRVRRLPLNAFPDLPARVVDLLNQRQCLVPQTYAAHHPENVIHASLEHPGSSDWAVLCSTEGKVSLLVFFGSSSGRPIELASSRETDHLQLHDSTGVLGFNWAIDPASPEAVHEAQRSQEGKLPPLDHDALADSIVDRSTAYHVYNQHKWTVVQAKN